MQTSVCSNTDANGSPAVGSPRSWPWLAVGAVLGAAVTGGLLLAAVRLMAPAGPAPAMAPPVFVEEAHSAGLDHAYEGDFEYFVGGGVAAFDCDDDHRPELFLAGGSRPASLHRNESSPGGPLRFTPIESPVTDLDAVTGAYPIDADGDGVTDLVVLRVGENVLLRGLGGCRFERAGETLGLDGGSSWTVGFSAFWPDDRRLPTMVFGNYLRSESDRTCDDHALVTATADGEGDGNRFAPPVAVRPGWCSLSMLFSDWQRTGRMDLRVANDRHYYLDGQEQLFRIDGRELVPYTAEDGWQPLQIWGMGIAGADLTGDGRPEFYITSQGDNKLQTLVDDADGPRYRDIALERGVTAHRPFIGGDTLPSTAWHPQFADVNNDGLIDLYVSKGNVDAMPEFAQRDPANLLLGQPDGTFTERADVAGIVGFERGRGAAVVDLNLDGMLDVVQVNRQAPVSLWRNLGWSRADEPRAMGRWLQVRVSQDGANRDAVGAWVEVRADGRTQTRELTIGGGHASGLLGWTHFGLGDSVEAQLRVVWPDGERSEWFDVSADRFVLLDRAAGGPVEWRPS